MAPPISSGSVAAGGLLRLSVSGVVIATSAWPEETPSAYASADRIQIDVADHCGGLPPDAEATMFCLSRSAVVIEMDSDWA
jgi:hypothetical protein